MMMPYKFFFYFLVNLMPSDDALQVITKQILAQSDDALIPLCVCQFDIITWHIRASTIVVLKNYF